jgi:hypothetical protein
MYTPDAKRRSRIVYNADDVAGVIYTWVISHGRISVTVHYRSIMGSE